MSSRKHRCCDSHSDKLWGWAACARSVQPLQERKQGPETLALRAQRHALVLTHWPQFLHGRVPNKEPCFRVHSVLTVQGLLGKFCRPTVFREQRQVIPIVPTTLGTLKSFLLFLWLRISLVSWNMQTQPETLFHRPQPLRRFRCWPLCVQSGVASGPWSV